MNEKIKTGIKKTNVRIGKLMRATADHIMIKEVWTNLIDNAVKFSIRKTEALIEIGSEIKGNEILYYIRDNGIGFSMNYQHKLFGLFQRLHDEQEYGGIGIGLAIAKRIISQHNGRIWADSEPGKGTTFYFTLPAQRDPI